MKNKINLLVMVIFIIMLNGCGSDSTTSTSTKSIATCTPSVNDWTLLSSGDTVTADAGGQITFNYDSSGNKRVCMVSGTGSVVSSN